MPLYEYRCTACGYSFEKIQSFSAPPESVCPKCSGELIRPLSAPALQFKGAGWYINDYSSKGSAGAEKPAAESTSSEARPAEARPAETKSADSSATASATPAPSAPAASSSTAPTSPAPSAG